MDRHTIRADGRDHDVVIAAGAIVEQHDDRPAILQVIAERVDAAGEGHGLPAARPHGLHQHAILNPARRAIHERSELLDVGVRVSPIAKDHRHGRAAAEVWRLR